MPLQELVPSYSGDVYGMNEATKDTHALQSKASEESALRNLWKSYPGRPAQAVRSKSRLCSVRHSVLHHYVPPCPHLDHI